MGGGKGFKKRDVYTKKQLTFKNMLKYETDLL